MKTKELDKSEYAKYAALAKEYGSIFNSLSWVELFGDSIKLVGIYNNDNELIGGFHYYVFQKFGFNLAVNPPFTPNNGLFFRNDSLNKSNQLTFEKKIIELLANYIKEHPAKLFVAKLAPKYKDTQPFHWNKLSVKVKYTYHLDITLSDEVLLNNLTSEKRKSLNKAIKDNITIKRETDMSKVKEIVLKTFKRKNEKLNEAILDKILSDFANEQNTFAFVAYDNGKPKAASFCVYDNNTAYYLLGGYDDEERHHGAGVSCMWQSIKHAQSLGLKTFDFEGSMIPEVERYYREFGGDLVPYYEVLKSNFLFSLYRKIKKQD